jgi:hypothetical protein
MKKSLIALAALAAFGTASAQSTATISGKFRIAYESNEASDGAKTAGVGVSDGDVVFGAVEDLGGGLKAAVSMAVRIRGRGQATDSYAATAVPDVRGRDSSISLTGGFGTISAGSVDVGFLHSAALTSAVTHGLDDDVVILKGNNSDFVKYTTPSISGFTFSVAQLDAVGAGGAQSTATTQDAMVFGATYANGPLSVVADYSAYGDNAVTATRGDDRLRFAAKYDLGVAVVGFGRSSLTYSTGNKRTETVGSVTVPVGAMAYGLNLANSTTDGTAGTNKGLEAVAQYNLSKRTFVAAAYQRTTAAGAATDGTKFRVQIGHSF